MKPNQASADRAVRVFGGLAFLFIAVVGLGLFDGMIGGIVCAAVGVIMLVTGAIGFCPAYTIAGVSTCPLAGSDKSGKAH